MLSQCCGAEPCFLGSGSRYFFSVPAPSIKARLRPAPAPKNSFWYKTFEKYKTCIKKPSINLDLVPKTIFFTKSRFTQSQKMYLVVYPYQRGIRWKPPTFVQNDFTPWCLILNIFFLSGTGCKLYEHSFWIL